MADDGDRGATTKLEPERENAVRRALEHLAGARAGELEEAEGVEIVGREIAVVLPCDRAYLLRVAGATREMMIGGAYPRSAEGLQPGQVLPEHSHTLELLEGDLDVMVCSDTSCWGTGLERQLAEEGLRSALGVVLRWQGEPLGVLVVASRRCWAYGPGEVRVLRRMAPALGRHLGSRQPASVPRGERETREQQDERALMATAGSLSHYFNNLVAYLLGGLEPLQKDDHLAPETAAALARMEERLVEGAGVVRALQQFAAETPADDLEEIELAALVDEVIALASQVWEAASQARERQLVTWHQRVPGRRVRGNRRELTEALVNVLINAAQAMPQGGIIRLTEGTEGQWNYVEVCDQGEGMNREVLKRAREPFFTTRRGRRCGLGLSVTAGILRRHGGEVSLISAPGQGTTVRLNLLALNAEERSTL